MTATRRSAIFLLPLLAAMLVAPLGTASSTAAAAAGAAAASTAAAGTASTQASTTSASAASTARQCPAVLPVADVRTGMRGRGLTVTRGSTPQPFAVEVLGVLPDALAPGRDIILIEVSDLAGREVIAQGGGIWGGMSGSPVYIGGKLLGAIAFGFSAAPSPIGGVTPAEEMVKLLRYPARSGVATAQQEPARIAVPESLEKQLAAAGASTPGMLERLRMPLSVSGLGAERLARLQADADEAGLPVIVHAGAGGTAPTATTTLARPTAGGNFVAALSYGDVTAAGIGTTTAVCGGNALAFGHPFQFAGQVGYGANDATALTIVKDSTFGSFKFATIGAPIGMVDQDRLAGIRSLLGVRPDTTPVLTSITAVDLDRTRNGRTDVTDARLLPSLTFSSVLGSYDAVFDEIGDGSATNGWTIRGTRAGGVPFELRRSNRWASQFDIASDPAFDVAFAVDRLLNNEFETVRIDGVRYTSRVSTVFRQLRVVDALVSVNGGPFARAESLEVPAGALLTVRAVLQPYRDPSTRTVELSVRVPAGAAGRFGSLQVVGGAAQPGGFESPDGLESTACLLEDGGCAARQPGGGLDALLDEIRSQPRNDDVSLVLRLDPAEGQGQALTSSSVRRVDQVVAGSRSFFVGVTG